MTWIVGRALPFGYAAAVSDVRVTIGNVHRDCLQKVHEVGPRMAMGFAGNVWIGFRMVKRLQNLLAQSDQAREPEVVARWWPYDAREVFELEAQSIADPSCELMLLSAHPTNDIGIPNIPRCSVHCFRSPGFEPVLAEPDGILPGGSKAVAIGCGNESARYREVLDHVTDFLPATGGPVMHGEFTGRMLVGVRHTILNHPNPDVSPFLQLCTVSRGYVRIMNADGRRYGVGGDVTDFTVPKLVANLDEYCAELGELGDAADARC